MPYMGCNLSVNTCWIRGRGGVRVNAYKPEVKLWMGILADKVKELHVPNLEPPAFIVISGRFRDERRPDMDNLQNVICNGLKRGLGLDDKHFRASAGEIVIDSAQDPVLLIQISQNKIESPNTTVTGGRII